MLYMRKFVFILLIIFSISVVNANDNPKRAKQLKSDIAAAKAAIKNAVDMEKNDNAAKNKLAALEKNENTIRKYILQNEYKDREDLHLLLIELIWKQYEVGNNKMYLKQQTDTAWYVKTGRRLFLEIESFDSLDSRVDAKGVSTPSYRKKHAETYAPYIGNIQKGGIYFLHHKDWSEAWNCFDMYLDSRKWPVFASVKRDTTNDTQTAYYAILAANNLNNLEKAKKYAEEALTYKPRYENALILLSNLSIEKGDTTLYIDYIKRGFKNFTKSEYFFPRLIDYYTAKGEYDIAENYVDEALRADSTYSLFLLAKHSVLMSKEKYDDALRYAYLLKEHGDSQSILDYNMGYIYYIKAQQALKQPGKNLRLRMKDAQKYYKFLLPYMERYRSAVPEDREKWYPVLYDAYLNLNMGKEFNALKN